MEELKLVIYLGKGEKLRDTIQYKEKQYGNDRIYDQTNMLNDILLISNARENA